MNVGDLSYYKLPMGDPDKLEKLLENGQYFVIQDPHESGVWYEVIKNAKGEISQRRTTDHERVYTHLTKVEVADILAKEKPGLFRTLLRPIKRAALHLFKGKVSDEAVKETVHGLDAALQRVVGPHRYGFRPVMWFRNLLMREWETETTQKLQRRALELEEIADQQPTKFVPMLLDSLSDLSEEERALFFEKLGKNFLNQYFTKAQTNRAADLEMIRTSRAEYFDEIVSILDSKSVEICLKQYRANPQNVSTLRLFIQRVLEGSGLNDEEKDEVKRNSANTLLTPAGEFLREPTVESIPALADKIGSVVEASFFLDHVNKIQGESKELKGLEEIKKAGEHLYVLESGLEKARKYLPGAEVAPAMAAFRPIQTDLSKKYLQNLEERILGDIRAGNLSPATAGLEELKSLYTKKNHGFSTAGLEESTRKILDEVAGAYQKQIAEGKTPDPNFERALLAALPLVYKGDELRECQKNHELNLFEADLRLLGEYLGTPPQGNKAYAALGDLRSRLVNLIKYSQNLGDDIRPMIDKNELMSLTSKLEGYLQGKEGAEPEKVLGIRLVLGFLQGVAEGPESAEETVDRLHEALGVLGGEGTVSQVLIDRGPPRKITGIGPEKMAKRVLSRELTSGIATTNGKTRSYNEDATIAFRVGEVEVHGVFDGHGDPECRLENHCSYFVATHLQEALKKELGDVEELKRLGRKELAVEMQTRLDRVNRDLYRQVQGNFKGGTCGIYTLKIGDFLVIANFGDSRALTVDSTGVHPCSIDPRPSRQSAVQAGRKNVLLAAENTSTVKAIRTTMGAGNLAVLADMNMLGEEAAVPEVYALDVRDQELQVIASDGLFEKLSTEEVGQLARGWKAKGYGPNEIAQGLCNLAMERGAVDNISVVVQFFDGVSEDHVVKGRSIDIARAFTPSLNKGALFVTTEGNVELVTSKGRMSFSTIDQAMKKIKQEKIALMWAQEVSDAIGEHAKNVPDPVPFGFPSTQIALGEREGAFVLLDGEEQFFYRLEGATHGPLVDREVIGQMIGLGHLALLDQAELQKRTGGTDLTKEYHQVIDAVRGVPKNRYVVADRPTKEGRFMVFVGSRMTDFPTTQERDRYIASLNTKGMQPLSLSNLQEDIASLNDQMESLRKDQMKMPNGIRVRLESNTGVKAYAELKGGRLQKKFGEPPFDAVSHQFRFGFHPIVVQNLDWMKWNLPKMETFVLPLSSGEWATTHLVSPAKIGKTRGVATAAIESLPLAKTASPVGISKKQFKDFGLMKGEAVDLEIGGERVLLLGDGTALREKDTPHFHDIVSQLRSLSNFKFGNADTVNQRIADIRALKTLTFIDPAVPYGTIYGELKDQGVFSKKEIRALEAHFKLQLVFHDDTPSEFLDDFEEEDREFYIPG